MPSALLCGLRRAYPRTSAAHLQRAEARISSDCFRDVHRQTERFYGDAPIARVMSTVRAKPDLSTDGLDTFKVLVWPIIGLPSTFEGGEEMETGVDRNSGGGRFLAALGVTVALAAIGIGFVTGGSAAGANSAVAGTFVGKVANTSAFIAVVAGRASKPGAKRLAVAYICDGKHVSTWYFGHATGNSLDLLSKSGKHAHVTLDSNRASGTIEVPGRGTSNFSAGAAGGVAGVYLVNRTIGHIHGFSGLRARLDATATRVGESGAFRITGTVKPRGGAKALTLKGPGTFFGPLKQSGTWIVLRGGHIAGATTPNTTAGGNCSIWSKIKSIMSGVFCGFLTQR